MENLENVDLDELEKFSSQASEWWNKEGPFKTLHEINPTRLRFITKNLSLENTSVLDIGCGGGLLAEAMARQGAHVTGLDASRENIEAAIEHASTNKIDVDYVISNAETYSVEHQNKYDLITCMELLEHVPDPVSIIKACAIMIKPGGHIMLSTINRNLKSYLLAVVGGEYLLNLLPKGTHQYANFIRPSELIHWCKEHGLTVNDLKGMRYNPLLKQCHLENKADVNYLLDTISL